MYSRMLRRACSVIRDMFRLRFRASAKSLGDSVILTVILACFLREVTRVVCSLSLEWFVLNSHIISNSYICVRVTAPRITPTVVKITPIILSL